MPSHGCDFWLGLNLLNSDGAYPGLMKWIGLAGGQKWFEVPLCNMDTVGDESLWDRGHCLLCVCPAPNITELHPIAWTP